MNRSMWTQSFRLSGAAIIAASLTAQAWADLTYGTFTWAQLPGYFTPLANMAGIVALLAAASVGQREPGWVASLRMNATTYLVVVGIVYWTMLAPHTTPKLPWVNVVLHGGAGALLALDWLLVGGARLPRWRMLWTVMTLPAAWMGYLLIRATTDGWVPYPFLDPSLGFTTIAATVGLIVLGGLGVAALLRAVATLRPRTRPEPSPSRTLEAHGPRRTAYR